jgi:hypothetical protein
MQVTASVKSKRYTAFEPKESVRGDFCSKRNQIVSILKVGYIADADTPDVAEADLRHMMPFSHKLGVLQ